MSIELDNMEIMITLTQEVFGEMEETQFENFEVMKCEIEISM